MIIPIIREWRPKMIKFYQLDDVIKMYGIDEELINICIINNWIVPVNAKKRLFDQEDLSRLCLIKDLRYDMGVNDEAIPIIMSLLDQIHWLKKQIS